MFDLEAQRKSSASIGRLLGLAKDETGVRYIAVFVSLTSTAALMLNIGGPSEQLLVAGSGWSHSMGALLASGACRQVLVIASVMLLVGSLSSVAVPRLSGQLIDISINYAQSGEEAKAKRQANGERHTARQSRQCKICCCVDLLLLEWDGCTCRNGWTTY